MSRKIVEGTCSVCGELYRTYKDPIVCRKCLKVQYSRKHYQRKRDNNLCDSCSRKTDGKRAICEECQLRKWYYKKFPDHIKEREHYYLTLHQYNSIKNYKQKFKHFKMHDRYWGLVEIWRLEDYLYDNDRESYYALMREKLPLKFHNSTQQYTRWAKELKKHIWYFQSDYLIEVKRGELPEMDYTEAYDEDGDGIYKENGMFIRYQLNDTDLSFYDKDPDKEYDDEPYERTDLEKIADKLLENDKVLPEGTELEDLDL